MTDLSLSSRAGVRPIELGRGNTLALEQAAGVTVRVVEGSAWLSGGRSSYRMRAGDAIAITNNGTTLVYSFEHASVCLEGTHACNLTLRRRGEVAASGQDDDACVNLDDASDLARWADRLCTSAEELRQAIEAVGPRVGDVKRYLLLALVRKQPKR